MIFAQSLCVFAQCMYLNSVRIRAGRQKGVWRIYDVCVCVYFDRPVLTFYYFLSPSQYGAIECPFSVTVTPFGFYISLVRHPSTPQSLCVCIFSLYSTSIRFHAVFKCCHISKNVITLVEIDDYSIKCTVKNSNLIFTHCSLGTVVKYWLGAGDKMTHIITYTHQCFV